MGKRRASSGVVEERQAQTVLFRRTHLKTKLAEIKTKEFRVARECHKEIQNVTEMVRSYLI